MKRIITSVCLAIALITVFTGCAINNQKVTYDTQVAATFALLRVPTSVRPTVANYYDVAAGGLRSVNGTPSLQVVINEVMSFIPQSVQTQYPAIPLALTGVITFAYQTYGQAGLNDVASGLEAAAAPYISPPPTPSP